jgi:diguanylate cyclase
MQTGDSTREETAPLFDPRSRQDVYRVAAETMDLINRHDALPDPVSYAVWFAFAAKSNGALVDAVSRRLAKSQTLSPFDVAEIFAAFLEGGSASALSQTIGLKFEDSLTAVSELIVEGSKNNASFRATLDALGQRLPTAGSAGDIDAIVSRLVVENEKMARAMQTLDKGLAESQAQIERLNAELGEMQQLSLRDPLTEVANRRAFDARLAETIQTADATHSAFCLAMTDIDHFKRVNDTLGHQSGDGVLRGFAGVLRKHTKGKDLVARCGGEEFAIILPQTSIVAAHNLMVKIAAEVREAQFLSSAEHDRIGRITASFGVCEYKPGLSGEALFERADAKLYTAKHSGRDCVRSDLTA